MPDATFKRWLRKEVKKSRLHFSKTAIIYDNYGVSHHPSDVIPYYHPLTLKPHHCEFSGCRASSSGYVKPSRNSSSGFICQMGWDS